MILGLRYHTSNSEVRARYLSRFALGVHTRSDPEVLDNQTSFGDAQTPTSHTSSQTVVGTSADPDTGLRTSFKRKRDESPADSGHNFRPFVAGGDGDSLPHYLTVGLATLF